MKTGLLTQERRAKLAAFCQKWGVARIELFGSALSKGFRPDSDVDLLVTLREDSDINLFDWAEMKEELQGLFEREVDLVSRRAMERSRNPFRRQAILGSAKEFYVAG
jgi:hypothetical protein